MKTLFVLAIVIVALSVCLSPAIHVVNQEVIKEKFNFFQNPESFLISISEFGQPLLSTPDPWGIKVNARLCEHGCVTSSYVDKGGKR